MKKIIAFLLVTFMIIIPFSAAYAADNTTNDKTKRAEFKAQIAAQKEAVKQLRDKNQAIRDQIKQKHIAINAALKVLKGNKDAASKAKLEQVKTALHNLSISASRKTLEALKDAGLPYWEAFKENAKNMNVDGALANLSSIANVRNSRYEPLTTINATLDTILNILK
jgi:hypothetical protein